MRDEDGLPEPQLSDDGIEVTDLIVGSVRIAGRLVRTAPPEKIKQHDAARRREVRRQPVVEVYVVREPVHENDRRFRPRVVSDVDPMVIPLNKSLLVGHHYLGTECYATDRALELRVRLLWAEGVILVGDLRAGPRRTSISTLRQAVQPNSSSSCNNAAIPGGPTGLYRACGISTPIASQALALLRAPQAVTRAPQPPTSMMNSRRFIGSPLRQADLAPAGRRE